MAKAAGGGDADDNNTDDANDKGGEGKGDQGKSGADKGGAGKGAAGGEGDKTYTQAELDAALAEDRKDRKRAAASKAAKTAGKKKSGGDDDDEQAEELTKERQRREQAEEQLRVRDARDSVESAAKAAGFNNPAKIYRLVKDELEFDDAGKPENVKDLIALAKRDFPEELAAKGKGSADGGAGGDGKGAAGGHASMNDFIRRAAGRAT